jgi:hypothetical protein
MAAAAAAPRAGGAPHGVGDAARFGVLTVSDRASGGVYDDLSGPAILGFFGEAVASPWEAEYRVVADERPDIEAAIIEMVPGKGGASGRLEGPGCGMVVAYPSGEKDSRGHSSQPGRRPLLMHARV